MLTALYMPEQCAVRRFYADGLPRVAPRPGLFSLPPSGRAGLRQREIRDIQFAILTLDNAKQCIILTSMRTAKTISITLSPDLLVKAQKTAEREDRTISELFREALRRYITADPEWDALLRRTRSTGNALGIASEADVERMSDEFRQEKLQPAGR